MSILDSFIEIASWQGSREEAQGFVDAANGNLETALMLYFDNALPESTDAHPQPAPPIASEASKHAPKSLQEEINAEYTKDIVSKVAPRVSGALTIFKLPLPPLISGCLMVLDYAISLAGQLVPQYLKNCQVFSGPIPKSHEHQFESTIVPAMENVGIKPKADRFMLHKTYNEALEATKREFKFLLVVIVSEAHSIAPVTVIERLLRTRTIYRDDVYVWISSALTIEGMRIAKAFQADQLPLISLIGVSPKSADSTVTVMERLVQVSGDVLANKNQQDRFDNDVDNAILQQEPKILSIKLNRQQFDADREIRQEQDSAYEKSLSADREKAEKAKRDREEQKEAESQHAEWLDHVVRRSALYQNPQSVTGEYARISLRFPNGDSLNIRALRDAPVSDLFAVVYAHLHRSELPDLPTGVLANNEISDSLRTEIHSPEKYGVTLTSTVTRSQLKLSDDKVRDNPAVWPSGVLMVDALE